MSLEQELYDTTPAPKEAVAVLEDYAAKLPDAITEPDRRSRFNMAEISARHDVLRDSDRVRYRVNRLLGGTDELSTPTVSDKGTRRRLRKVAADTASLLERQLDVFERPRAADRDLHPFYLQSREVAARISGQQRPKGRAVAANDEPSWVRERGEESSANKQHMTVFSLGMYIHLLQVGAYDQLTGKHAPHIEVASLENSHGQLRDHDPNQRDHIRSAAAEAEVLLVLLRNAPEEVRNHPHIQELEAQTKDLLFATRTMRGNQRSVESGNRQRLFARIESDVQLISRDAEALCELALQPEVAQQDIFQFACYLSESAHNAWARINDNQQKLRILPHTASHLSRETRELDHLIVQLVQVRATIQRAAAARPDFFTPEVLEQYDAFLDSLSCHLLLQKSITADIADMRTEQTHHVVDTEMKNGAAKLGRLARTTDETRSPEDMRRERPHIREELASLQSLLQQIEAQASELRNGYDTDPVSAEQSFEAMRVTAATMKGQLETLMSRAALHKVQDTKMYHALSQQLERLDALFLAEQVRILDEEKSDDRSSVATSSRALLDTVTGPVGYRRILSVMDLWQRAERRRAA